MTGDREDLRDQLLATLHAATELPPEDRAYLADSFLEGIESRYDLVPRGQKARSVQPKPPRSGAIPLRAAWLLPAVAAGALMLIPVLLLSLFVLVHPPIIFLAVMLLFLLRAGHRGPWRRFPPRRSNGRGAPVVYL